MRPSQILEQHREMIRRTVLQFGMSNPRLFGSALHGDDVEGSDLDILVDAPPRASLFALAGLQVAIETTLGTPIDLLTPDSLPLSFRDKVLAEAIPV